MKKKIIAIGLLAALTISIGAMAGCGSSGSDTGASSSEISSASSISSYDTSSYSDSDYDFTYSTSLDSDKYVASGIPSDPTGFANLYEVEELQAGTGILKGGFDFLTTNIKVNFNATKGGTIRYTPIKYY